MVDRKMPLFCGCITNLYLIADTSPLQSCEIIKHLLNTIKRKRKHKITTFDCEADFLKSEICAIM